MKLTVQAQPNEWWHEIGNEIARQRDYPTIIHEWWDGLEWRDHPLKYEEARACVDSFGVEGIACNTDYVLSMFSDLFFMEEAYKFFAYQFHVMGEGFAKEWQNILTLVGLGG